MMQSYEPRADTWASGARLHHNTPFQKSSAFIIKTTCPFYIPLGHPVSIRYSLTVVLSMSTRMGSDGVRAAPSLTMKEVLL